jgi:hypothetical protein
MKIVFSDSRINEYKNGTFHVHNDGKPIDVPSGLVVDLLAATVKLDNQNVNVFMPAKSDEKAGKR